MPPLTKEYLGSEKWRADTDELQKQISERFWSDEEIRQSLRQTLEQRPATLDLDDGLWVFAYGSLIWNPLLDYDRCETAFIKGYSRRFCLRTLIGRGSPEHPGLVLALDQVPGEETITTEGRAFRIKPAALETDLFLLWRREMVAGAYRPFWIDGQMDGETVPMISFAIDRQTDCYESKPCDETTLHMLKTGRGFLGSSLEYFSQTLECFRSEGIHCPYLESLAPQLLQKSAPQDVLD